MKIRKKKEPTKSTRVTRSQIKAATSQAAKQETSSEEVLLLLEEEGALLVPELLAREQDVPTTYDEAMQCDDREYWKTSVERELGSLEQHKTAEVVLRPSNKPVIPVKYVFKVKPKRDGTISVYKARLVTQGFRQIYGVNYSETFAPVARLTTIRFLLSVCAELGWQMHQVDIKAAFLQGDLEEKVFVEAPQGSNVPEGYVWKLNKALYGLKQAHRVWYKKLTGVMKKLGLTGSKADPCLFYRLKEDGTPELYVVIYVDDIIIAAFNIPIIENLKEEMANELDMEDMGQLDWYLGMAVDFEDNNIKLSQKAYVDTILARFGISAANAVATPMVASNFPTIDNVPEEGSEEQEEMKHKPYRSVIGSLQYLAFCTRPDISLAVSKLACFVENPGLKHWTATMRVLRYLVGTRTLGLIYRGGESEYRLVGNADASYADGDSGGRRSTTGYLFARGGSLISWVSYRQRVVARSTTEAEYVSLSDCGQHAIWLRRLTVEMGIPLVGPTVIYEDNNGWMSNIS
jgi:hypothetical protein